MQERRVRITGAFPIVISGPSGAGKTTLVDRIVAVDPLLRESVSVTTRPPRAGEIEGGSYFFMTDEAFGALQSRGGLIEWAEVHGHRYGTPREFVERELSAGRDVVLNIDVQGGESVKKDFPNSLMVFILPPSMQVLEERIRRRGTDYARDIDRRLINAREEIQRAVEYDYIVENEDLEEAVRALQAIIVAERCRRQRYPADYLDDFVKKP